MWRLLGKPNAPDPLAVDGLYRLRAGQQANNGSPAARSSRAAARHTLPRRQRVPWWIRPHGLHGLPCCFFGHSEHARNLR